MVKNLLILLLTLAEITFYHANTKTEKEYVFFCDTLPPTNVQVENITLTSGLVTWTADPNTPDNMIRIRAVGSPAWVTAIVPSGQNFYNLTGLMSCTAFEVQVIKICNNVIGTWSNPLIFTTSLNYCMSASTDSNVTHISNVTVTPVFFPQMVSNSGTSNYTDYRPDPNRKVKFLRGSTHNVISVTRSWSAAQTPAILNVWIDINSNGIFEAVEKVISSNTAVIGTTVTSTFAIPPTNYGQTSDTCFVTMRVKLSDTSFDPCGSFLAGEVEDYGVEFFDITNLSVIETGKNKETNIYPNPVSDKLFVSGIASDEKYEIYSVTGQKVKTGKTSQLSIDMNDLKKGTYFLLIKNIKEKFIKK